VRATVENQQDRMDGFGGDLMVDIPAAWLSGLLNYVVTQAVLTAFTKFSTYFLNSLDNHLNTKTAGRFLGLFSGCAYETGVTSDC